MTPTIRLKTKRGTFRNYGELAFWLRLSKSVRENRQIRGMSQLQLAEAVDLHPSSITNLEQGKQRPDVFTICAIAVALDVDVAYLLGMRSL